MNQVADPRLFPQRADTRFAPLLALVKGSLEAASRTEVERFDRMLVDALVPLLRLEGDALVELLAAAPSAEVARHLWRRLGDAWQRAPEAPPGRTLAATLFALPLVIVVGNPASAADSSLPPQVDGVLHEVERIAAILREHRALGGSETFALSNSLVTAESIDVPRLPALLRWQADALARRATMELPPAPITARAGEGVHLRFIGGVAFAGTVVRLRGDVAATRWGMPLAQELARQLGVQGLSVLALPRPPQDPLGALQQGRAAQREVGAQLFATNAIRRFRASVGEPSAVISAHRCPSAPGGGELRLSLSSPFDPKDAEGFRCPLFIGDRAGDVATMLIDLLRDCRANVVRVVAGVHPDRDPATGLTLLFKPDALPEPSLPLFH